LAGIGFELKKLFGSKGFLGNVKAYAYAGLISIGPQLICVGMIITLQLILAKIDTPFADKELFIAGVVYAFIFSQIITSGFLMSVTRYISDMLYQERNEMVLASFYGLTALCLMIGGVAGFLFYYKSSIDIIFKLTSYILFMELIIMWTQTVYLSALKDYMKIIKSYMYGLLVTIASVLILYYFTKMRVIISFFIALDLGIFTVIVLLMISIKSYFDCKVKKYFDFLRYFDKFPSLFYISFFYTVALYSHNFIFWFSNIGVNIDNTFRFAPLYDVPVFFAFLTIMPAMVLFVVSIETSFYEKYRHYYSLITGNGNFKEISSAKKEMRLVLWQEIRYLMEIQLFFSALFLVLGIIYLPAVGLAGTSVDIFAILILGAYCDIVMLILVLILLYFDDRKGALYTTIVFIILTVALTLYTKSLGQGFYGFGFFIAAFISMIFAIARLFFYMKDIDYYTYSSQPIVYKERKSIFYRFVNKLYGLEKVKEASKEN
jgi:uncharacterized membrane protein